ncbi:MAG: radical SAM protein [Candidatus Omnitrophica bacterium]|nr:radical SAM protein [Candidatus Omnitrophota bacterium]
MKVYLVNPPACDGIKMVREGRCMQRKGAWTTVWPPVTLATMAAMFLKEGIEVKLDDCIVGNISFDQLKLNIRQFDPDLLVINTATASINSDLSCAKIAKEVSARIKTLAFGLHVTALPDESLKSQPALDFVIRGEPEFCLLETVRALKDSCLKINTIKGLSYRSPGGISHNPDLEFNDNLDVLPFPAWELIDVNHYLLPLSGEPFLLIMTAKGCPHACLFCPAKPYYGSRLRQRDHKIVVDEMEYDKRRFKVRQFLIWSESFTEDREYTVKLCNEIINRKIGVSWVCNSRVDKVDLELLKLMRHAGCWMIGYGIESGSQEILDAANKGTTIKQIEDAVNMAKSAGLETTGHVIFGLPKETMESGLKTINWLKKLNIDFIQVYCAVPWPSTALYHIARENGWLKTRNWELYEQNNCVMEAGRATVKQVESLRKMAIVKFYLSPKRIFRVLKKINSFKKAGMLFNMFKEFADWI